MSYELIAKTFIALRVHTVIEWTFTHGKLRALNCLLQSRCGYSVDEHPPRHLPRHRQCRWPPRRLLVQAVSGRYIVQYSSSDYDNNIAFGGNIIQPPWLMNTAQSAFPYSETQVCSTLTRVLQWALSLQCRAYRRCGRMTGLVNGKVPFIAPRTFANSATWNQYNMLFCRPPSRKCNVIRYPSPSQCNVSMYPSPLNCPQFKIHGHTT